ncbi:hypothetical protein LPJ81_005061 [Coemansia sp. IMI 209127]|nr:hypothetical protein LPJ81_005061 [Coemansia sp. IMI 209127]
MKIALSSIILAIVAAAATGAARTVRSTIHIDRPSADATISFQLQEGARNELIGNGLLGNDLLGNEIGRNEAGIKVLGPNEIHGNELLGNEIGRNEAGIKVLGPNEIHGNELGRNGINGNELLGNELPGNAISGNRVVENELLGNEIAGSRITGNEVGFNEAGGNAMLGPMVSQGLEHTLIAHRDNHDYSRILLGFNIPNEVDDPKDILRCILRVPKPRRSPKQNYELIAYAASSNWSEASVTSASRVSTSRMLGSALVQKGHSPGDIDVTEACRAAMERKFSVMLDSSGPIVVFDSRNSNKHRPFKLEMTYSRWKD